MPEIEYFDGDDDPKKPRKLPPEVIAKQNADAKRFGATHGMANPENLHVDDLYGAPMTDEAGNIIPEGKPQPYPLDVITDITKIPVDVRGNVLHFDAQRRLNYYEEPQTSDPKYVSHEIAASTRFNPDRGKSKEELLAKN